MVSPREAGGVAIVGMAVLLPGAPDLATYWRNLVAGVDAITEVPASRWDPAFYEPAGDDPAGGSRRADRVYCRRGGFVDDYAHIDPARFGIMPTSVPDTEPDQLIALQVAEAAIADAGGPGRLPAADRVGVVLGRGGYLTPGLVRLDQRVRTANQLVRTLRELLPGVDPDRLDAVRQAFTEQLGPHRPESAIGLVPNLAASRIANRLDLRGPAYTVDAACASSLIAVDQAVTELAGGRCDAVLAGGVHHCHDITLWSVFAQLRALSRREQIRPFDRDADGILIGEGTGVVVLKRLADALRDEDRIYAVIRGTGVASDGRSASLFNPEPAGQARAVRRAWQTAGLDPAAPGSIGMLEAHGTGTPAGDAAELATLADVFGPAGMGTGGRAVIGSVKSMIGHTMPAAGVASLVKAALAVHRGVLLPTLHCENPRPELDRTRFQPIDAARPWEVDSGLRRAGVNAFGFGGINAHVVLEQTPDLRPRYRASVVASEGEMVLRLAARTPAALGELLAKDDWAVRAAGAGRPATADTGCRLGIVGPTTKRLALARRAVAQGRAWRGRGDVWFSPAPLLSGVPTGRTAFVFPGLEAGFAPRTADISVHFGLSSNGWVDGDGPAADVGRHGAGVVAVGRLLDHALRRLAIIPDAVAGHSVGEWTAMVCAGLYSGAAVDEFLESFDPDSVQVPGLAFAAIGAGADRVGAAITDRPGVVLSHDNAPRQSIVCGPQAEVERLVLQLRGQGVLCQVLPFRSGFHTPMLAPYLGPIQAAAQRFQLHAPSVPVWSATTAAPFPTDPQEVRQLFVRHLLEPVRFRQLIEAMYDCGIRVFIQVGSGQLASVIDDILHGRDHLALAANAPQHSGIAQLRRVATALWTEGAEPDLELLDDRRLVPAEASAGGAGAQARLGASAGQAGHGRRDRQQTVTLNLGGALLSLGEPARHLLPVVARAAEPVNGAPPAGLSTLHGLADRFPLAAELATLLTDTAQSAAAVIDAAGRGAASQTVLRVSVETMPYLLDHCFFRRPDNWPDLADRWPVVPATTVIQHMLGAAEQARPGMRAVALHDVRFSRWVVAAPPVDVPVAVVPTGVGRLRVSFGQYAQAEVELAESYPAQAPAAWAPERSAERRPEIVARQLYEDRWMFHGPLFQGVTELTAIADTHVRGVLTTPAAPGALLDNVGQLLGYWIMSTLDTRTVVFPVGMGQIRFYGPEPPAGTALECMLRIRSITEHELIADAQLSRGGQVWAQLDGWVDRRFDSHPETRAVERFPEHNTLSRRQQRDWVLLYERWPDLASRDLIMRNHLGGDERAEGERQPPRARRQRLLGRIAVKDAVRHQLWDAGAGAVFPAEVAVSNDAAGRPGVRGVHGRAIGEFDVSVAHCAEVGVAIARRRPPGISNGVGLSIGEGLSSGDGLSSGVGLSSGEGLSNGDGFSGGVGIDVEEVAERSAATVHFALSEAENDVLARACADTGEPERLWFTRFWTAKEAVAKAEGTGLAGRPRQFAVVAAEPTGLVVEVGEHAYRVEFAEVSNPDDLPDRQYVVAWTTGHRTEQDHDGTQEADA